MYATTGRGLYRTTNGGTSWRSIGPPALRREICRTCPLGRGYTAISFAIDPTDTDIIYAAATPTAGLLYESSNGGDTWRRVPTATPLRISGLVLTASGALLASSAPGSGMFRSTDGGLTWAVDGLTGATIEALTVDPGSGAIYATTGNGATAFRTTDDGDSWQTVPKSFGWFGTVTDPTDAATIYATTNDGVVKSLDGGQTWAAADKGLVSMLVSAVAVAPGSPARVYAGTGGPLFESTNMGKTWRAANTGLGNASVTTLAVDPKQPHTVFAGTSSGGLFESSDAGARWSHVQTALNNVLAIAIDPEQPSTMYVVDCRTWCSAGTLRKTNDAGAHWRTVTGVPSSALSLAIDPRHSDTMFVGTARGDILRSRDGGRSWRRVAWAPTLPLSHQYAIVVIVIDPSDPDTVYAGRPTGGIIKSSDGGDTWSRANTGLTNLGRSARSPSTRQTRDPLREHPRRRVQKPHSGASWRPYDRGLPAGGVAAFAIDPGRPHRLRRHQRRRRRRHQAGTMTRAPNRQLDLRMIVRLPALLVIGASVLLLTAWTTQAASPGRPGCSVKDTRRNTTLVVKGGFHDAPLYLRYCGPARAVVHLNGKAYTIRGGWCRRRREGSGGEVAIGLIANQPAAPGQGVALVWPNPMGPARIDDAEIEVPGIRVAASGTATVGKGLKGGRFTLYGPDQSGPTGMSLTGSWTCG